MSTQKWKNPFYALLIPVGLVFVLTISAYVYMAFLDVNAARNVVAEQAGHPLFVWLRENGTKAVLVELGVLAALTVAAISTDGWWAPPLSRGVISRGEISRRETSGVENEPVHE